eukprot:767245-Hanusia_phi.AAC.3
MEARLSCHGASVKVKQLEAVRETSVADRTEAECPGRLPFRTSYFPKLPAAVPRERMPSIIKSGPGSDSAPPVTVPGPAGRIGMITHHGRLEAGSAGVDLSRYEWQEVASVKFDSSTVVIRYTPLHTHCTPSIAKVFVGGMRVGT